MFSTRGNCAHTCLIGKLGNKKPGPCAAPKLPAQGVVPCPVNLKANLESLVTHNNGLL